MQNHLQSMLETIFSTAVGFAVSLLTWVFVIKPIWGLETTFHDNFNITVVFTVASVLRGFGVRRLFNWLNNKNKKEANVTRRNHGARGRR